MKLDEVIQCIPYWYRASTEGDDSYTLISPPGQGKTATGKRTPHILTEAFPGKRWGFRTLNGGNMEVMDAQGYLIPRHHEGYSDSIFTRPFWYTSDEGIPLDQYDGGVVFVDEYDKAPVEVKKILGEGCYSKRLGAHTLPKGWCIWMAGNTSADRSGSTKELDHLINRTTFIKIEPDLDSWTNWATKEGALPLTIAFANNNPEIVFTGKVPEKQGPWCTPRSLMAVDFYLRMFADPEGNVPIKDKLLFENITGKIGEAATVQLTNTIKLSQDMPKYATIVANPMTAKLPERVDAKMLVAFNLAHRVTKEDADSIVKYMSRMEKEFGVTFAKAACNKSSVLVTTPAFQKWAYENSSLMALIAKKN
jgi:hypothetical protein